MIEKLTKEQEAQIPVYRQRGIDKGRDSSPVDMKVAKKFAEHLYKDILKKDSVPPVVIVPGPRALHYWAYQDTYKFEDGTRLGLPKNAKLPKESMVWPYLSGQFWGSWVAYYDYMHEVLGVELCENYFKFRDIQELGLIYPLPHVCLITEKMTECHLNAENRPHNPNGPAISYPDGLKAYCLNGVRVPEWLITTPVDKLDPRKFAEQSNVEVRREFVRKIGVQRLAESLGARLLDTATVEPGGTYELLEVDLGGQTGKVPYLKMKNPSIDAYHLEAVQKGITTVAEALKFRARGRTESPLALT